MKGRRDGERTDRAGDQGDDGGPSLRDLAKQRGISHNVLRAAGIRPDSGSGGHPGWWRLPYPHRTGSWKTRYRNPDPNGRPKYLDDTGQSFHLYNPLRLGPGEEEVWFAEGEFDTLALIDQGLRAIGIHGVANVADDEDEAPSRFRRSWKSLFDGTLCVVMFDQDDAGAKAGRRLARFLEGEVFDDWDGSYGDVNDWHHDDPDGLADALRGYRDRVRRGRGLV